VLESVNTNVVRQQERSEINDNLRLAVEQLDREIRSGNVLYDPALESPSFYSLRVYTQSNAPTAGFRCIQWRIEDRQLIRREWPPGDPGSVSGWRVIAEDVVNRELNEHAFTLDPDPAKAGRTVEVTLVVDDDLTDADTSPVRIQTSLTGRNTSFDFPLNVCEPAPPG
jgi:hypothetical protein